MLPISQECGESAAHGRARPMRHRFAEPAQPYPHMMIPATEMWVAKTETALQSSPNGIQTALSPGCFG
ncbi:hypothetical protein [Neisseria sp. 19428wB4_WF04]|uniref:hypothetical protein n=1 Tax=Neisseria sp. 19428wB4_WF04 TaxID=2782469 RepID=UPI001883B697|nr:hypothetical protein [Neisseria sp. 19428wB4_WF04]